VYYIARCWRACEQAHRLLQHKHVQCVKTLLALLLLLLLLLLCYHRT
jgi:hypothetical protein